VSRKEELSQYFNQISTDVWSTWVLQPQAPIGESKRTVAQGNYEWITHSKGRIMRRINKNSLLMGPQRYMYEKKFSSLHIIRRPNASDKGTN